MAGASFKFLILSLLLFCNASHSFEYSIKQNDPNINRIVIFNNSSSNSSDYYFPKYYYTIEERHKNLLFYIFHLNPLKIKITNETLSSVANYVTDQINKINPEFLILINKTNLNYNLFNSNKLNKNIKILLISEEENSFIRLYYDFSKFKDVMRKLKIDTNKLILISYKSEHGYNSAIFLISILKKSLEINNIDEYYVETDIELKLLLKKINSEVKKNLLIINLDTIYSEVYSDYISFKEFSDLFKLNTNNYELFFSNNCLNNDLNFSFFIIPNCNNIFNFINHEFQNYFDNNRNYELKNTIYRFNYGMNLTRLKKLKLNNEFLYNEIFEYFDVFTN